MTLSCDVSGSSWGVRSGPWQPPVTPPHPCTTGSAGTPGALITDTRVPSCGRGSHGTDSSDPPLGLAVLECSGGGLRWARVPPTGSALDAF